MTFFPSLSDIETAMRRIGPYIHRTPIVTSAGLDALTGTHLHFKCENLQKVGAFKIRGAANAILSLSGAQAGRGVATHSSGNHGAAVALAARWRDIPATVVMPTTAPAIKLRAVTAYGASIVHCDPTLEARETALREVVERTQAVFIPPYNDSRVVAGQATVTMEMLADIEHLDALVAPVGGGGLLSGTLLAAHFLAPHIRVYGAEPINFDDAYRSIKAGALLSNQAGASIADGLLTSLGDLTFAIIQRHVNDIVRVSEEQIVAAMRLLWERLKLVVEPSGAVAFAAVMAQPETFSRQRVGIILSGGNVDLDRLPFAAITT